MEVIFFMKIIRRYGSIQNILTILTPTEQAVPLSSAIASGLAKGMDMYNAVKYAKNYISGALEAMMNIGHGNGPVNHMWNL